VRERERERERERDAPGEGIDLRCSGSMASLPDEEILARWVATVCSAK
jgi:hypothetical protein